LSQWGQVAVILVLVLSVGYLYLDRLQLQRQFLDANSAVEQLVNNEASTIAVLPFVDMSAEGDQQYFGNGIAEEILNALVAVDGLQVAARTSSFSFLNANTSITDIGNTLGVKHILEGSIRQSGERIRITAQLIDVSSGFHLFSQAYERRLEDIFEIQNEIASEIVTALLPHVGVEKTTKLVRQGTRNLAAHKLRLRARHTFYGDTGKIRESVALLQEAIKLDPQYWAAWGDLSYAYGYHSFLEVDPLPILMRAQLAFSVALANDPDNVPLWMLAERL
jgi:TolB-like protein